MLSSRHVLRHDMAADISRVSDFRFLPAIEPHFTSVDPQLTSVFTQSHRVSRSEHVRVLRDGPRRGCCDKENVGAHQTNNGFLTGHANNAGKRPRPIQRVAISTCSSTPIVSASFLISIHETSHLFTFIVNTINIYTNMTETVASCRACLVSGIPTTPLNRYGAVLSRTEITKQLLERTSLRRREHLTDPGLPS
jgi:hypothetical protein